MLKSNKINKVITTAIDLKVENQLLKSQLLEAQTYKADAEKYKELQKVLCPIEGLSIRLEYRDGDIIFCNVRSFSILEVKHLPTIRDQIKWSANWLWDGIEKAINDEAVKEGKS